jgi:hypothetical protein
VRRAESSVLCSAFATLVVLAALFVQVDEARAEEKAPASPSTGDLLTLGSYHEEEVLARPGDIWMSLLPTADGARLLRSAIRIEKYRDELAGDPVEQSSWTGKRIVADAVPAPIFFVAPSLGLTEGPVSTTLKEARVLEIDRSVLLSGVGAPTHLTAIGKAGGNDRACQIVLTAGAARQVLEDWGPCDEDGMPAVFWAGDIDRDGKLDLLADVRHHYNSNDIVLFLSSRATGAEMVGRAARFSTSGC